MAQTPPSGACGDLGAEGAPGGEGRQGGKGEGRSEQCGGTGPRQYRAATTDGTAARTPREMVERLAARLLAVEERGGESSPTNESELSAPPNQWTASLFPSRAVAT